MKIAFGCDHAGYEVKRAIIEFIESRGHRVIDFGCDGPASCDYPDFAKAVAESVASGECARGVLLCGTGVGMSIAANKTPGIRAGVCWNDEVAVLVSEHNDANVLCMPARFASTGDMSRWIELWLATPFSGQERHKKRLTKIAEMEQKCGGGKK